MANQLYPKAKQRMLSGQVDLMGGEVRAALIDTGAAAFDAAHEFFASVAAGVVGNPVALAGKSVTDGVFDAADATFVGVVGPTVEALVLYQWTGNAGTSPLLMWIDTATGLPFAPHGGNVLFPWDNGASRIFRL